MLLSADIPLNLFKKQDVDRGAIKYFWEYFTQMGFGNDFQQFPVGMLGQFLEKNFLFKWCPDFCMPEMPNAMALARHHGIPSRLLDWSIDPMVAAYFSVLTNCCGCESCVFALNRDYIRRYCEKM